MMIEDLIIEEKNNITKIAGMKDGSLCEFMMQKKDGFNEGNIYLGKIVKKINTANGKEGYFVNIGDSKDAFINAEERELEDLKANEGQDIVVQITQEQRAEKGARVVRFLHMAGINLVYCPYGSEIELSNKIVDEEQRNRLYDLVVNSAESGGWIIRTHAAEVTDEDIANEIKKLENDFRNIMAMAKTTKAPQLLFAKENILEDIIIHNEESLQKIIVNNHLTEEKLHSAAVIEYEAEPFKKYGVDEMLNEALQKVIKLRCGGRVIIEETKALVAIDVDSGDGVAQGGIGRVNQEAAYEIAKQIILRNLSGKIIIDFEFLKGVMEILEKQLQNDVAKAKVLGLSRAGNVEIVRTRKRPTLRDLLSEECPTCQGTGRVEK